MEEEHKEIDLPIEDEALKRTVESYVESTKKEDEKKVGKKKGISEAAQYKKKLLEQADEYFYDNPEKDTFIVSDEKGLNIIKIIKGEPTMGPVTPKVLLAAFKDYFPDLECAVARKYCRDALTGKYRGLRPAKHKFSHETR